MVAQEAVQEVVVVSENGREYNWLMEVEDELEDERTNAEKNMPVLWIAV
jgi:hypothetical protein